LSAQVASMKAFADMGLDVVVMELDVRLEEPENKKNLAARSEVYKNTTAASWLVDACVGITVWDFYDPISLALWVKLKGKERLMECRICGFWGSLLGMGMGQGIFGLLILQNIWLMRAL